jgi:inosine-uridine nucleoside N-ribohydrolase
MSLVPLLLDTDIGDDVDDVFALLLVVRCPSVSLQVVTTVFGDVGERCRIARKLLRLAGRPDIPVVAGHGVTLKKRDPGPMLASGIAFARDELHDSADSGATAPEELVSRIHDIARAGGPAPLLVAIGPLTNVGVALRLDPTIAQALGALVLMGGRLGSDAERGEHNVNMDPEATKIVLESGVRLRIGTFEVTCRATLDRADEARLVASPDVACRAAGEMLGLYFQQRQRDWTSMYDPLTLTLAYTDAFLTTQPARIAGTYADQLSRWDVVAGAPNADVSVDLDAPAFHKHLLRTIGVSSA